MNFFLWINEAQRGPYSWDQIKALLAEKSVTPETPFWKEGMTDWQPLSSLLTPDSTPGALNPAMAKPRIFSGFWRRLGALIVDLLILCLAGHLLGMVFFDSFCRLGSFGPLLGLGIALLYFGLQNSYLCGGQTPGKRLLRIEVVDPEGKWILPAHSLIRYLILGLPFFVMDPMVLGPISTTWTGLLLETLLLFWIATITYLFLFNIPSRQSLHDLIVKTYVVRTVTRGEVTASPFWTWHYIILCLMGLGSFGLILISVLLMQWGPLANQLTIVQAIELNPHVAYASSAAGENWTFNDAGTKQANVLNVEVFWNGKPDNMDESVRSIAATILTKAPDEVAKQDTVVIQISYGYDIVLTSATLTQTFQHSPQDWQQIVTNASPP